MRKVLGNDIKLGSIVGGRDSLRLTREQRRTHLYVCGSTGTGKSKLLEHMIRQDILSWHKSRCGLLLLDPHGSLYDGLIRWAAWHNLDCPIVPIDLRSSDWVMSYNALRQRPPRYDAAVLISAFVQAMAYVWGESGTDRTPLFARWISNILWALYDNQITLVEAEHLIDRQAGPIRYALTQKLSHRSVAQDWAYVNALPPRDFEAQISSSINRLHAFLQTQMLRRMFGQAGPSLDLGEAIEKGSIILVNLSTEHARVSEEDGALLATLLLSDLWTAAKDRGKATDAREVKPFYVYVDEFQNFITPTIAKNLDQARGFGLHLTLANQFPRQILHAGAQGPQVYDSVMANTLSKFVFETHGRENLEPLADDLFMGVMNPDEIKRELYSTKVMDYIQEDVTVHSESKSSGLTHGHQSGQASGAGLGGTSSGDDASESWSEFASASESESESFSEGTTVSKSTVPRLRPILGKELANVQFRPLDEQKFRAMAVLHDQKQRHGVVRLAGVRDPVCVSTPIVDKVPGNAEHTMRYIDYCCDKLPFALRMAKATEQLALREKDLPALLLKQANTEPTTAKRRIRKGSPEK